MNGRRARRTGPVGAGSPRAAGSVTHSRAATRPVSVDPAMHSSG